MAIGDENVTIRINVKADTREIDRVRQKLERLCRQAEDCNDTFANLGNALDDATDSQKEFGRENDRLRPRLQNTGRAANSLAKIFKTSYKFALIGAGIETAALAVALSSVNGLLATGRFLVKSYQVVMSGLAKAAAAAGVALATVAAAQRQYVAAQATGRYGGSFAAASQGLRTLTGDARLASLGVKTLTGAFQAASKNARVTGATASALAGLMDFAVASGDVEKGAAALANLISLVQKGGAGGKGVAAAAQEIGPEFQKAFNEVSRGGKATADELLKAFASGELARRAGLAGGFGAMQGSLVGQLKAFMTQMQVMFGDLGMQFIEPVQKAFDEIRRIMVRTVTQLMPVLADFSTGGFLDKVVSGIDKMSTFLVTLMREYVPKTQGFFESMSRFWDRLTSGFERFNKYLQRFSEASRVINKFFGQIFGAIGGGLRTNFEAFGQMLVDNQVEFDKFGKSLANLITQIFRLFNAIREAFMGALPYITKMVDAIASIVSSVASLLNMLSGMGGFAGLVGLGLPFLAGFGSKGAKPGSMRARYGKMSPAAKGGVLGGMALTAGLATLPGIGGFAQSAGTGALLGGMLAPAGFMGAGILGGATVGAIDYTTGAVGRATGGNAAAMIASGAGVGLAGGAATGAMIGALGGPIGAGAGALIGAAIGGVMGLMKNSQLNKEAKKAANRFVENYASEIEDALGRNDRQAAREAIRGFSASAKEFSETQVKQGTALSEAEKKFADRRKDLEKSLQVMDTRFTDLQKITGQSEQQIRDLANAMEVDLGNANLSLMEILEQTGIATRRFGDDFNNALIDTYSSAIANLDQTVARLKAPQVAEEAAQALREQGLSKTITTESLAGGLQTLAQQELLLAGGDPVAAMRNLALMIGTGGFSGTQFTTPGGAFYDPQGRIFAEMQGAGLEQLRQGLFAPLTQQTASLTAQNITGEFARIGMTTGMTVDQLTQTLATMNPAALASMAEAVRGGQFLTSIGGVQAGGRQGGGIPLAEQLKQAGLGSLIDVLKPRISEEEKNRRSQAGFIEAMSGFKNISSDFGEHVRLFGGYVEQLKPGDTSTPRRNIVDTLGAHSRFDMQIAGNRTVTSGLRGYGLGSLNSDHAAGRAYDLVGQNLGLYQASIRASGGYAEFHGGAASRHLHVVPSVAGRMGDDATPLVSAPMPASSSTSSMVNNIVINQQPGQDAQTLAREVIYQIERMNKSKNERY